MLFNKKPKNKDNANWANSIRSKVPAIQLISFLLIFLSFIGLISVCIRFNLLLLIFSVILFSISFCFLALLRKISKGYIIKPKIDKEKQKEDVQDVKIVN
jgi:hypothetical protein